MMYLHAININADRAVTLCGLETISFDYNLDRVAVIDADGTLNAFSMVAGQLVPVGSPIECKKCNSLVPLAQLSVMEI